MKFIQLSAAVLLLQLPPQRQRSRRAQQIEAICISAGGAAGESKDVKSRALAAGPRTVIGGARIVGVICKEKPSSCVKATMASRVNRAIRKLSVVLVACKRSGAAVECGFVCHGKTIADEHRGGFRLHAHGSDDERNTGATINTGAAMDDHLAL